MADIERPLDEAAATDLNKGTDTESQTSENELDFNVDNVVADFSRLFAVDSTSQVRSLFQRFQLANKTRHEPA